jgi:hypothetical protein
VRLVLALFVQTHEAWLEENHHLDMTLLAEQKMEALRE